MRKSNYKKEWPFLILFVLPWLLWGLLRKHLPDRVPSHYSASSAGMVADSTMAPLSFVLTMTMATFVVYCVITAASFFPRPGSPSSYASHLYVAKLTIVSLLTIIPCYTMLSAAQSWPDFGNTAVMNIVMLILLIILNAIIYYSFKAAEKKGSKPLSDKYFNIIWAGSHLIPSTGPLIAIMSSYGIYPARLQPQLLLLFLAICGNLIYNIKPNSLIGIRMPWTLNNAVVWRKTHHTSGIFLFTTASTGFVASIFAADQWLMPLLILIICSNAIFGIIYSYIVHRQVNKKR